MGRQRAEKTATVPSLITCGTTLANTVIAQYIECLRCTGRSAESLKSCDRILRQFQMTLKEGRLETNSLAKWREQMQRDGYAVRTVNSRISTVNAFLEAAGRRDCQLTRQLPTETFEAPELTRAEYLRMLQTAKTLGDHRGYVLAKLFATTGVSVSDLPFITVESAKAGCVETKRGIIYIPPTTQADLLAYAAENGRATGAVFVQKGGAPLARTQVSLYLQKLGRAAQIAPEKANVRALRQLHRDAIAALYQDMDNLVRQAYERQLREESGVWR